MSSSITINVSDGTTQGGADHVPGTSANPTTADLEARRVDEPNNEFCNELRRAFSSSEESVLGKFLTASYNHPRFVWHDILLSFYYFQEKCEEKSKVSVVRKRLTYVVGNFNDILERELFRDGLEIYKGPLEMENRGQRRHEYGAVHAAVLCQEPKLVDVIFHHSYHGLIRTFSPDTVSFDVIKRVLLWANMVSENAQYDLVVGFLKELDKAKDPQNRDLLMSLMDKSETYVDFFWILILAWSLCASSNSNHILPEFLSRRQEPVKDTIIEKLRKIYKFNLDFRAQNLSTSRDSREVVKIFLDQIFIKWHSDGLRKEREKVLVRQFYDKTSKSRWTPLHLAAARGDQYTVNCLIQGCDHRLKMYREYEKNISSVQDDELTASVKKSLDDAKYMTPLHYAVLSDNEKVVDSLIKWKLFDGSLLNQCDVFMRTALQMACSMEKRGAIAKSILQHPQVDVNIQDCCSWTSLKWAISTSSVQAAEGLLKSGCATRGLVSFIERTATKPETKLTKNARQLLFNLPGIEKDEERLYRDRGVYVDASNAILVGAALIASVTFGGWLQPPLGNKEDSTISKVRVFWAFSSLSFFFSIACVVAGAGAVLPAGTDNIAYAVESIRRWLIWTSFLLILAVACVLGAFAASGFSSLSSVPDLTTNMTVTTSAGGAICTVVGIFFCVRLVKVLPVEDLQWLVKDGVAESYHWIKARIKAQRESSPSDSLKRVKDFCEISAQSNSQEETPSSKGDNYQTQEETPSSKGDNYQKGSREHWQQIHAKIVAANSRTVPEESCPIRNYYDEIENLCCRKELDHLTQSKEIPEKLQEYVKMWDDLSSTS